MESFAGLITRQVHELAQLLLMPRRRDADAHTLPTVRPRPICLAVRPPSELPHLLHFED